VKEYIEKWYYFGTKEIRRLNANWSISSHTHIYIGLQSLSKGGIKISWLAIGQEAGNG